MNGQIVLVDGYNIIRQWQEARFLGPGNDLDPVREQLINHLCSCFSYWGTECWLVFDAHLVPGGQGNSESRADCLQVFYTREGQTADAFIERSLGELQSAGHELVVCTSDWAEQNIALTRGAQRLSARDFLLRVRRAEQEMSARSRSPNSWRKSWLEDSLPDHVQQKLRELRDLGPEKLQVSKKKNER